MDTRKFLLLLCLLKIAWLSQAQVGPVAGCPGAFGPTRIIEGPITLQSANGIIQWKKDTVYILKEVIRIAEGTTLRLEPGTIVMAGTFPNKTYLIIEPGAKILSAGTSINPVVFTSCRIQGTRQAGDWGGVVLLGKAGKPGFDPELSHPSGILRCQVGTTNDNSGSLAYTRIEYAGAYFAEVPNNTVYPAVSGLLLMGVGPGTVLQFLQVTDSYSDSYHFRNSTVNGRNLVSWKPSDDDFELMAHKGLFQFGLGYREYSRASDFLLGSNGIECKWENAISSTTKISNFELWGPARDAGMPFNRFFKAPFYLTHNTKVQLYNSLAAAWPTVKSDFAVDSLPPSGCGCPMGYELDPSCSGLACPPPDCCRPLDIVNGQNNYYEKVAGYLMNIQSYQNLEGGQLKIKKNIVSSYPTYTTTVCASGGATLADAQAEFSKSVYKNVCSSDLYNGIILQKKAPLKEEPLFALKPGSPMLSQSSFGDPSLSSDLPIGFIFNADTNAMGFANVSYVGAFGGTEWTQGWSEFNPNILKYMAGAPPTKQGMEDAFLLSGDDGGSFLLSCFPNPSRQSTTIHIEALTSSYLSVSNLNGQEMMDAKPLEAGSQEVYLHTETWPNGFYFVRLKDATNRSSFLKLSVSH